MEFKVGDKVKIKNNLKDINPFRGGYTSILEKYVGDIVTIKKIYDGKADVKENDWIWDTRAFEKINIRISELKFGDILTLRNKDKYVYADGRMYGEEEAYYKDCDYIDSDYNDDLKYNSYNKDYDIVKVERAGQVIYERGNEVKEMTVEEISKELGYEVKIVKEEK